MKIKHYGNAGTLELKNHLNEDGSLLQYLQFPAMEKTGIATHAFSTRIGGASKGIWSSMNLSFTRGDDPKDAYENFHRYAVLFGVPDDRLVLPYQTHTVNVRVVTEEDGGKGFTRERDYTDVDGLITNVPGLVLAIFVADCVPLLFLDPVHKAIGASHSGWRGTVNRMGKATIEKMREIYGTDPKDLLCAIGPSICRNCYEVSDDVASEFKKAFPGRETEILNDDGLNEAGEHKFHLDLWNANRIVMEEAGVRAGNISMTDICTNCNPELLFSHRFTKGQRGNNGAFIMLK
ncbi:peptidoglycan editing factor PgeF [Oribacterium sp. P6A1]|uniref:peptidoglycan editing factor PgeF n=1 Tax=Oribacterium sp. P6A1 TaxID=1410612 RepID=UPI00068FBF0F|nr:peptidoglycan editing factor PgeF [Oribacterium sp. P6A1]